MRHKFKDSKMKEMERQLLYNHIVKQINNKQISENTVGFSLCSDSVVLERHLSEYTKKVKKPLIMICAERSLKPYKIAKKKLAALQHKYFGGVIWKCEDHELFDEYHRAMPDMFNKLDFAWHDWCGFLTKDTIKTVCISAQCIKEGGLLAITVAAVNRKDKVFIDKCSERFKTSYLEKMQYTEQQAHLVPSILNNWLDKDKCNTKKGLRLLDAIIYSTSSGETLVGTKMLFYIFKVETRNRTLHDNRILRRALKENLEKSFCHNGETYFRKEMTGLR